MVIEKYRLSKPNFWLFSFLYFLWCFTAHTTTAITAIPTATNAKRFAEGARFERVFVSCGDRSVLIIKSKYLNKQTLGVTERIGDMPTDTQK